MKSLLDRPTVFDAGTDPVLCQVLEQLRVNFPNNRVRLFMGDPVTGENWLEEHDVMGRIGRTTGPQPCPILLHNARSIGGSAILTKHVLRVTLTNGQGELYRHPAYKVPELTIVHLPEPNSILLWEEGYQWRVDQGDEWVSAFKSEQQAKRWVAFMRGERNSK